MPNFCDRIADAAARVPHHPAIVFCGSAGTRVTTYRALVELAESYASRLEAAGVRAGDRAAILAANDAHWIAAYLGILRLGAVAVPLDTAYAAPQVATILADAGAPVVLVSDRLAPVARDAAAASPVPIAILPLDAPWPDATGPASEDAPDTHARHVLMASVPVDDDAPAAILYTSGTTADPKGVVLTHGNLEAERAAALAVVRVTDADAVLGVLPLFHALAQMTNLLLPLSAGARVVFLETVNSTSLLAALESQGITVFACVPQFFYLIHQRVMDEIERRGAIARRLARALIAANRRLRDRTRLNAGRMLFGRVHRTLGARMRMLITGGSRFDPEILADLYGLGLTILNGYGLTETSGAATVMRPGDRFTTSVGPPLPGVEVRIAPEPELTGGRVDEGEILIRGPIVMRGYFNRPDATAASLAGGWLRTGDLGRVDREGRVYVTGRKKDVIVLSSGKNLYPEEIEAHYAKSAFVRELCVLGVTDPSAPSAERLHALVVPDETALRARGTVNVNELIRFELEERSITLPAHKRILGYDLSRDPLPRTSTGKLKRGEIERQVRARQRDTDAARETTSADAAWLGAGAHRMLTEVIATRLGRAVHPDDNLELDLHLDSLERVEVLAALERTRGVVVPADIRATIFTVRHLVEAVTAAASSPHDAPADEGAATWSTLLTPLADRDVAADLGRGASWRAPIIYAGLRLVSLVLGVGMRVTVGGRSNLPPRGPFIITPNHQSYLDGFLVAGRLPYRHFRAIFFVGAAEYFQTRATRAIARALNIVPVDPDSHLVDAMRAAADGLRGGRILVLFPEGERSVDGRVRAFRRGAAILAAELHVPVVPATLDGLQHVWPRGRGLAWKALRPWARARVSLTFGAPITVAEGDHVEGTRAIQEAVARPLAGPEPPLTR